MKNFKRSKRVGEQIHHEVSNILLKDIKDPALNLVTVTGTKIADDLRHAVVFYSVIGDEKRWQEVRAGLERSKSYIKKILSSNLKIKYIPDLKFVEDKTMESGERIDKILSVIDKQI